MPLCGDYPVPPFFRQNLRFSKVYIPTAHSKYSKFVGAGFEWVNRMKTQ